MKSKEKVDAILESIREELTQFVDQESQITSSTEYEDRVFELSKKFAKDLITKSQGKMAKSRNSKKNIDKIRPT
jgi:hypothetical protein